MRPDDPYATTKPSPSKIWAITCGWRKNIGENKKIIIVNYRNTANAAHRSEVCVCVCVWGAD